MLKQFLKIFKFPLLVLCLHVLVTVTGVYANITNFDKLMHLLGGMSIAMGTLSAYALLQKNKLVGQNHPLVVSVAVVSVVVFTAVGWEWFEFLLDAFTGTQMQISITDTMGDLLAGTLGGATICLIKLILPHKK